MRSTEVEPTSVAQNVLVSVRKSSFGRRAEMFKLTEHARADAPRAKAIS